ncbi:deoxyribose-phosphate aldolase [Acholeplasma morum]|jgi:deoxyribose-phosphate aldolase|uniref:deoxyribose-phosphate aldolase n=1 Tax=Paracholeplasma morum TaxID=264637 RepID=UPI0019585849|nr:deoxyribose-phosphate aldolase [Paracholeplasma morum]MBM7453586.1 deoxyribose-phosphate aldolase [Paracholeplasma morum]
MLLNKYIDHTKLGPAVLEKDIIKLCEEAKAYDFMSVCVNPNYVKTAKEALKGSSVLVCTVVGFPSGAHSTAAKAFETKQAVSDGADEIDMVISVGNLKDKKYDLVLEDIKAVVKAADGKLVKVILETCLLTKEEIVKACELTVEAKADFVKTSTGFSTGGATEEDIRLMRQTVGPNFGVKASGGVRNYEDAMTMINAGATRIGASSGIKIMENKGDKSNDSNTSY